MGRHGKPVVDGDGRRARWAEHRSARRGELIEAVLLAVRERGPDVGMDDVAAVSGIAKPVFYRYFQDKADLYLSVGREAGERLVAEVVVAVERESAPRAMLEAGIGAFLAGVEADPDVYRFVVQRPAPATAVGDYAAVVGRHISSLMGDLLGARGLDTSVAEPWGFAMVGAVRAAAERWLEGPTMTRAALAASLTDLLWAGCRSAATGSH